MRLPKSNPSGRLYLVSLVVVMACLLIPGAFAASTTADHVNDKGYSGIGPIVNFTTDPAPESGHVQITAGDSVTFTDVSYDNVTSRAWDFGDGSFSTDASPSHTYSSAGTYSISLFVQNATGSASNVSGQTVGSYTLPDVVVSAVQDVSPAYNVTLNGNSYGPYGATPTTFDGTTVNVGDALTFTDATTGVPTSWSWNFGDGSALITTQNATHAYSQPGTYVVYLTAGNVNGNIQSKSLTITIAGGIAPVSAFTAASSGSEVTSIPGTPAYSNATALNGTAPMTVTFTDKSTKSPSAWSWTNNGSVFSTEQNPTLTLNAGQYQIVQNVSNSQGSNLSSIWVNVAGPSTPNASFTATPSTGAAPLFVQFNDTSEGGLKAPTSWNWNFGDGSQGSTVQNATHTYTAAGTYTVTLQTRNGAGVSNLATGTVTVGAQVAPIANFSINGTEAGNYATNSQQVLVGQPISFNDTSVNATGYNWVFSDGQSASTSANVTRTFTTPGTYWVYHTVSNAAGSNAKLNLFTVTIAPVNPAPVASFTMNATTGEAPLTVGFTNTSTHSPTAFSWLINGQQVGADANLTYTFTTPGTYNVALIAANSGGSSISEPQTVTVTDVSGVPNANFTFTSSSYAAPSQVQFTYAGGNATSFAWNFDDGTTSTEMNPVHTYQTAGTYSVRLTTTNSKGTNSKINDVTITPLGTPVASFDANSTSVTKASAATAQITGQSPFTVVFNDTSSQRPTAWYWNLGDGTTSTSQNITHTYTTPGKYAVYLVVANSLGASDYVYSPTLINVSAPLPVTDFTATPSTGAAPLNVQFTDTSSNNPFAWAWNFGDGSISGAQNPSHTYTTAGNYTVTLTTQNSVGTSQKQMTIQVISLSKPVSNFTFAPAAGQAPLTVQFTDTSLNSPSSWSWTFTDDFSTSNVQNPVHTFKSAGTYGVLLTASNAAGSGEMKLQTITVSPAPSPVADFTATPSTGVAPLAVQFTDKSTNADQWVWNFGDGASATTQNPTHTYQTAGTYTAQLQAVNSTSGLSNTKSMTITVTPAPSALQAAFNANPETAQIGQQVAFTDASTGYPAAWSWDFGDGFTASSQNVNHIYSATGVYTASLTVTNGSQTSTATKSINITTVPTTTTTTTVTPTQGQPYNGPHNAPGTVQAEDYDLGGNNVAYYDTTAGNAGGAYRTDDVDIEAGASGYTVAYVIGGEYLTYSIDAAAAGSFPVTISAANPDGTAKTVTVSTGSSSTTISVPSTGSFDTFNTFTSAGTLSLAQGRNIVKVTFGSSRMNLDYITFGGVQPTQTVTTQPTTTVTTQPTTGAASFTVSPASGKKSLTVALTDTTTGGNPVSWQWNCGNGQTFSGQNIGLNRIWYNNAGTYTITLTVTDANGTTRTATQTVTVTN